MGIVRLGSAARRLADSATLIFSVTVATRLSALFRLIPAQAWADFYKNIEPSRIAWALVSGFGYSSPWPHTPIAPTAQQPPVYPLLLAGIFRIAGLYSFASLWTAVGLNAFFSALTAVLILRLGQRDFSGTVGRLAAWFWAMWLYEAVVSIRLWESGLTALLLALTLWWLPGLRESSERKHWGWFGLLEGLAVQTNTTMLAVVPCFYVWLWTSKAKRTSGKLLVLSVSIFVLVLIPWTVRNYLVFGRILPLRDNFGLELWVGNHPGVYESHRYPDDFPGLNPAEFNRLGEIQFMETKRHQAWQFIHANPREFVRLIGRRVIDFWIAPGSSAWFAVSLLAWAGLAYGFVHERRRTLPYACVVVFFPVVYYITHTFPTYRHPIEPVVILLAAYALWSGIEVTGRMIRNA
jgi:hypothetical protein